MLGQRVFVDSNLFFLLQGSKGQVLKLNQAMETMTKSPVESSLKRIMGYASRPLSDFNTCKYKVLQMLESLQHTAQDTKHKRQNFYRLVNQTVRGRLDVPCDGGVIPEISREIQGKP